MTRIYSANTNLQALDISKIEQYKHKSKSETTFYSENGTFSLHKGELIKYYYNDENIIQHKIGNNKVIVDNSNIQKKRGFFQLPNGYIIKRTEVLEYKTAENSDVKLVITLENGITVDFFFYTKIDYTHPEVDNVVSTFLSLLNFY